MLEKNQIHLLGSDCHNLSSRRPDLGGALKLIEKRMGNAPLETVLDWQSRVFSHK